MRELGWNEDLDYISSKDPHPLFEVKSVRQPHPLTDRAWLVMKEEVLARMQNARNDRLFEQYRVLLEGRLNILKEFWKGVCDKLHYYRVDTREVASFPNIKAIMDSSRDANITLPDFDNDEIKGSILGQLTNLQQEQRASVRQWIQKNSGLTLAPDSKVDLYDLAIISDMYEGPYSNSLIGGDFLIGGYSCSKSSEDNADEQSKAKLTIYDENRYEHFIDLISYRCRWNPSSLRANWSLITWVINRAGEDPAKVTGKEMDRKSIRYFCTGGCGSDNLRVIMDWREAVSNIEIFSTFRPKSPFP